MTPHKPTIRQRVMLADHVLRWCGHDGEDRIAHLIDLLADFRHWCDRKGLCFGDLDRRAYSRYLDQLHEPSDEGLAMSTEPTNADRAAWAREALAVFTARTYSGDHPDTMDRHDLDCAISDLICDLLHYARQQEFDPQAILDQACRNCEWELLEARMQP